MRRILFFVPVFLALSISLFPQSNEVLDEILAEEELSAESAAYILLSASGEAALPETRAGALEAISDRFSAIGDTVTVGEYALLLQSQFDLPRGLVSRIAPGPRYALRDLKFLNMIQGQAHTNTPLSGEWALRIIGRVLTEKEVRS